MCDWPTIYDDISDRGLVSYPSGQRNVIYGQGTSFDAYLNGRYAAHSFTTETPTGWSIEDRVDTHVLIETALEAL